MVEYIRFVLRPGEKRPDRIPATEAECPKRPPDDGRDVDVSKAGLHAENLAASLIPGSNKSSALVRVEGGNLKGWAL
jgi:hypothetical protein